MFCGGCKEQHLVSATESSAAVSGFLSSEPFLEVTASVSLCLQHLLS
jgi:hypothetical protein